MTTEQARNLASARAMAARAIGWTGNTKDIPYDRREAYATELAKIVLTYPARFDALTLSIARKELSDTENSALGDYTAGEAVATFFGEVANQAMAVGDSIASVGEGAKSALNLAKWAIPVAVLVLAVVAVRGAARRLS